MKNLDAVRISIHISMSIYIYLYIAFNLPEQGKQLGCLVFFGGIIPPGSYDGIIRIHDIRISSLNNQDFPWKVSEFVFVF